MRGNSIIFRRFLLRRQISNQNSPNLLKALTSSLTVIPSSSSPNTLITKLPLLRNYICTRSFENFPFHQFQRTLSSSPDGPSNILLIKSGEEFKSSFAKVKDESLPAIFYFTAAWCGPCKFISPVIGELSANYPHVMTYKIDIDQEGLGIALKEFNIGAVPTLLFFKNGEKVSEIVGADVSHLKATMEQLYKKD